LDGGRIALFHVRGYTVDPEKIRYKTVVRTPAVKKLYTDQDVNFQEIDVWLFGATNIPIEVAALTSAQSVNSYKNKFPNNLVGLSSHSLGANVAYLAIMKYGAKPDFIAFEDGIFGGAPDSVLIRGGYDMENVAVIQGLRNESPIIKAILKHIAAKPVDWPPTIEIRGWFAMVGNLLFDSFPVINRGVVKPHIWMSHPMTWEHPRAIKEIAKFAHSINDHYREWR